MKTRILVLFLSLILCLSLLPVGMAAEDTANTLDVRPGTPVLDGTIDDIYKDSACIQLDKTSNHLVSDAPDTDVSAATYILYDSKYIYFAAEVQDPAIINTSREDGTVPGGYVTEGIELHFQSAGQAKRRVSVTPFETVTAYGNTGFFNSNDAVSNSEFNKKCAAKFVKNDGSYIIEVAVPNEGYSVADFFRFSMQINDIVYGENDAIVFNAYGSQQMETTFNFIDSEKVGCEYSNVMKNFVVNPGTPTLDGVIDDIYKSSASVVLNKQSPSLGGPETDISSTTYILYDSKYIYFAVEVQDSEIVNSANENGTVPGDYKADGIELHFRQADKLKHRVSITPFDTVTAYGNTGFFNSQRGLSSSVFNSTCAAEYKVSEGSYVIEAAIPNNGFTVGDIFQFSMQINDIRRKEDGGIQFTAYGSQAMEQPVTFADSANVGCDYLPKKDTLEIQSGTPTLDAKIDEIYKTSASIVLDKTSNHVTGKNPYTDVTAKTYILYDKDYIYIASEVHDSNIIDTSDPETGKVRKDYETEGIELFFRSSDFTNRRVSVTPFDTVTAYGNTGFFFSFDQESSIALNRACRAEYAVDEETGTYIIEVAIPNEGYSVADLFEFSMQVNDMQYHPGTTNLFMNSYGSQMRNHTFEFVDSDDVGCSYVPAKGELTVQPGTPVLDGIVDKSYKSSASVHLDGRSKRLTPEQPTSDIIADTYMLYDSKYIYFAAEVKNATLISTANADGTVPSDYITEGIELNFQAYNKAARRVSVTPFDTVTAYGNPGFFSSSKQYSSSILNSRCIAAYTVTDDDTYVIEVAIPNDGYSVSESFAFSMQINDMIYRWGDVNQPRLNAYGSQALDYSLTFADSETVGCDYLPKKDTLEIQSGTPELDGMIDDIYKNSASIVLDKNSNQLTGKTPYTDVSAKSYILYDKDYIYIASEVHDFNIIDTSDHKAGTVPSNYKTEGIELFFRSSDFTNRRVSVTPFDTVTAYGNPGFFFSLDQESSIALNRACIAEYAMDEETGTYIIEVAIPNEGYSVADLFEFSMQVNDMQYHPGTTNLFMNSYGSQMRNHTFEFVDSDDVGCSYVPAKGELIVQPGTPVLDGIVDESYKSSASVHLDGRSKRLTPEQPTSDIIADTYMLYDSKYIYFAAEVKNATLISTVKNDGTVPDNYITEGIELHFKSDDGSVRRISVAPYEAITAYGNPGFFNSSAQINSTAHNSRCISKIKIIDDNTYVIEVAIPNDGYSLAEKFDFSMQINDIVYRWGDVTKPCLNAYGSQDLDYSLTFANSETVGCDYGKEVTTLDVKAGKPKLDGIIDDAFKESASITVNKDTAANLTPGNESYGSATYYLLYDADYIYIAAAVNDPTMVNTSNRENGKIPGNWKADGIEIYFESPVRQRKISITPYDTVWAYGRQGFFNSGGNCSATFNRLSAASYKTTNNGYVIEAAIPNLGYSKGNFRISFQLNNAQKADASLISAYGYQDCRYKVNFIDAKAVGCNNPADQGIDTPQVNAGCIVKKAPASLVVDGKIDDDYYYSYSLSAGHDTANSLIKTDSSNVKSKAYLLYDEDYLYFAARVEDNTPISTAMDDGTIPGNWVTDGIEFHFADETGHVYRVSAAPDAKITAYVPEGYTDGYGLFNSWNKEETAEFYKRCKVAYVRDISGYSIEIAIPNDGFSTGKSFAATMQVDDVYLDGINPETDRRYVAAYGGQNPSTKLIFEDGITTKDYDAYILEENEALDPEDRVIAYTGTPVVDGKLDKIYTHADSFVTDQDYVIAFGCAGHQLSDAMAKTYVLHDGEYIYFATEVTESSIRNFTSDEEVAGTWKADGVELWFIPGNNEEGKPIMSRLSFSPNYVKYYGQNISKDIYADISTCQFASSIAEDGGSYIVEIAIPITSKLIANNEMGFALQINDFIDENLTCSASYGIHGQTCGLLNTLEINDTIVVHNWSAWESDTTSGLDTRTCTDEHCGATETRTTPEKIVIENSDMEVNVSKEVSEDSTQSNTATVNVEIPKETVESIITSSTDGSIKLDIAAVEQHLKESEDSDNEESITAKVTIPSAAIEAIANAIQNPGSGTPGEDEGDGGDDGEEAPVSIQHVEVETSKGSLKLPSEMLTNIAKASDGEALDVSLSFDVVHNDNQVDNFQEFIGQLPADSRGEQLHQITNSTEICLAVNVSLTTNQKIHDLNEPGTDNDKKLEAEIFIPFDKNKLNEKKVYRILYIDAAGNFHYQNTEYDDNRGGFVFKVDHFSTFFITQVKDTYTLKGNVNGVTSGTVKLELSADGQDTRTLELDVSKSKEFEFTGLTEGTYTLRVSKEKYVPRTYTIVISPETVSKNP